MKVKIGNTIRDSFEEPIMLIFDNDEQRIETAQQLLNMQPKNAIRKYVQYPTGMMTEDIKTFMMTKDTYKQVNNAVE